MNFKQWIHSQGLSVASARKYSSAVFGSVSDWAREAGLVRTSLMEINDPDEFREIVKKIHRLNIFIERNTTGNNMYSSALTKYASFLEDAAVELEQDIETILTDKSIKKTEQVNYLKTRIGQGAFRKSLLKHWMGCAVTGYKNNTMLIASHIKPWRESNNQERLDSNNGLILIPNLDKAFDTGFISFNKNGKILISSILENPRTLGISDDMGVTLNTDQHEYMEYHRDVVFVGGL